MTRGWPVDAAAGRGVPRLEPGDVITSRGPRKRYGIQSIPNIILFENGSPKAQAVGAQPKSALERTLGFHGESLQAFTTLGRSVTVVLGQATETNQALPIEPHGGSAGA